VPACGCGDLAQGVWFNAWPAYALAHGHNPLFSGWVNYPHGYNLFEAARSMLSLGPKVVLMKKGEHGAVAVSREGVFVAAAYPLESVKDPTGAGDSFAGGFMGHLAASGDTSWAGIKRALVFGSGIASFAVETVGTEGLLKMRREAIEDRYVTLRNCTMVESLAKPTAVN